MLLDRIVLRAEVFRAINGVRRRRGAHARMLSLHGCSCDHVRPVTTSRDTPSYSGDHCSRYMQTSSCCESPPPGTLVLSPTRSLVCSFEGRHHHSTTARTTGMTISIHATQRRSLRSSTWLPRKGGTTRHMVSDANDNFKERDTLTIFEPLTTQPFRSPKKKICQAQELESNETNSILI